MTNAQINIKLERIQNLINDLREDVEDEIAALQEKQDAIDEKASYRITGEMTEKEEERFNELEERKSDLEDLIDNVLNYDIEDSYLTE